MRIITGFHAIEETLRTGAGTSEGAKATIFYAKPGPRVKKILLDAKKRGIHANEVSTKDLDEKVSGLSEQAQNHRGIVLVIEGSQKQEQNFVQFDNFLAEIKDDEKCTVVLLDSVTDPHNVGAIVRSIDQFGANLIVVPERRGVSESEIIVRSSAGATAWIPMAVVSNLNRVVEMLKEKGFWVYGADAGGESIQKIDFPQKVALVMGSEGTGISRLLKEKCDKILSIPTCGKLDSLNVSVAAGVLLYEIHRQNLAKN